MTVDTMNCMLNCNTYVEQFMQNSIFSAFMMSNLINDLLDLAKLENSAFQLNYEQFNLIDVIEEAFQIIIFQAENKKIKLKLALDAQSPYIFSKIYSDKRRTLQFLLNFVSNSLKFTPNNGFIKVHLKVLEEQQLETQKDSENNRQ